MTRGQLARLVQVAVIGFALPTLAFGVTGSASEHTAARDGAAADYKVAIEKCDALSGAIKDSCVNAAKAKYRK